MVIVFLSFFSIVPLLLDLLQCQELVNVESSSTRKYTAVLFGNV